MTEPLDPVIASDYIGAVTGFTKLWQSIVNSTVWREELHTKVVWITMLALADRRGIVPTSIPGLADAARVTLEQCLEALERLKAPDKYSRTKTHEGRRIVEVDGGFFIYNYTKHRELQAQEERRIKVAAAVARYRRKGKGVTVTTSDYSNQSVNEGKQSKHIAEAEADTEAENSKDKDSPSLALRVIQPKSAAIQEATARRQNAEHGLRLAADVIFGYWRDRFGHPNAILDPKREKRIQERLRENGGDVGEILYALDGALKDDYIMGRDKNSTKKYDGIETVLRDRGQVERFSALVPDRNGQHPLLETPHD